MTENVPPNRGSSLSGKMFLFDKPELLTRADHGSLGFTPAKRPFEFVQNVRAIPLTMIEFGSAMRHYPIIFSNLENPVPLAIVGLLDDVNLFVEDGQWDDMCYVPTYLRCHPFAFAQEKGGQLAVVVDRAAASVSESPEYPFFGEDGQPSEHTQALMDLCAQYEAERRRTSEYCRKLVELDLLVTLRVARNAEGATEQEALADYVGIDAAKLDALPADAIYDLHKVGFLSASYLHLYSLENWRHLMARRVKRSQAA